MSPKKMTGGARRGGPRPEFFGRVDMPRARRLCFRPVPFLDPHCKRGVKAHVLPFLWQGTTGWFELLLHCGKPAAAAPAAAQKKPGKQILWIVGLGALLLAVVGAFVSQWNKPTSGKRDSVPAAPPGHAQVPSSTDLFLGQIVVKAGSYVSHTFTVEPGMVNFHVVGRFNASGGSENDIQAVLVNEDEFQNWINGQQAKAFYSTEQITHDLLDVGPLAAGRYVFAFSNKFSESIDKHVFAEIEGQWTAQK
jgi:hypothetical protein